MFRLGIIDKALYQAYHEEVIESKDYNCSYNFLTWPSTMKTGSDQLSACLSRQDPLHNRQSISAEYPAYKPYYMCVIFDLDGTLIDSSGDILDCIKESLAICQCPLSIELSQRLIGPPLGQMLDNLLPDLSREKNDEIVTLFRKLYSASGFDKSFIYDGVVEMLARLQRAGVMCLIATNKPRHLTEALLETKNIRQYFTDWSCSGDNSLSTKVDLILHLLKKHNIEAHTCIFVGDTADDMLAAHSARIYSVAHAGGYGDVVSLMSCSPSFSIGHMSELESTLLSPPIHDSRQKE